MQIFITKYLKQYSEILKNKKKPDPIPQGKPSFERNVTDFRGGVLVSITGIEVKIAVTKLVITLQNFGPWIGGASELVTFLRTLTKEELFDLFSNASPQNLKIKALVDLGLI